MIKKFILMLVFVLGAYFLNANALEQKTIKAGYGISMFGFANFCVSTPFFIVSNVYLYKAMNYQLSSFEYQDNHVYASGTFNYPIVQALLIASVVVSAIIIIASIVMTIVGIVYTYYEYKKYNERLRESNSSDDIPVLILKIEDN